MSGTNQPLSIRIDDAELRRELRRLEQGIANPAPAMREIGETLLNSTRERFNTETDPAGKRWAENSDVTLLNALRRKKGSFSKRRTATGGRTLTQKGAKVLGGKKILRDSGDLAGTLAYQLQDGGKAVAVGSNRIYAAMQQFGGTTGDWPHLWGDIPARPFLGVSAADREAMLEILADHLGGK